MGVFANVPNDKYDSLSPEDKAAVDAWRNQENDVDKQVREADVITREDNGATEKPSQTATRKTGK